MMKVEKVTQTKEIYYCDICGKKLTKKDTKFFGPWATLHYLTKYDKYQEEHDDFSSRLDLCTECNEKLSKLILEEWYKFKQKCEEFKKKGDK